MFKLLKALTPKLYLSFAEGDGDGDGNGAAGDVKQQLTELQTKLATLESEAKTLKDAKVDLEQRLEEADKELLSENYLNFKEKGKREPPAGGGGAEDLNLDTASNKEIVDFVLKKSKGDTEVAIKDIAGRIEKTEERIGLTFAQVDVALTALRHDGRDGKPRFDENQKVIFEIAKANPKWGAEKCYQQFLLQSTADAKVKTEADKKKAEEEEKLLTEKAGVPGSVVQGKTLSKEEAAEIGYRKAFGTQK